MVDGYTLLFAALLLTAGAFSDRVGARRAFGGGMAAFMVASGLCGLSLSLPMLVAARFIQGAAAAVMMPSSMALIREAYPSARSEPGRWPCGRWAERWRRPRRRSWGDC